MKDVDCQLTNLWFPGKTKNLAIPDFYPPDLQEEALKRVPMQAELPATDRAPA
jgi:hypothetical protein